MKGENKFFSLKNDMIIIMKVVYKDNYNESNSIYK